MIIVEKYKTYNQFNIKNDKGKNKPVFLPLSVSHFFKQYSFFDSEKITPFFNSL